MKYSEITANIRSRLGIAELNAMQLAVGSTRARKLMLLAPTGSGKTIAFAIALLRSLHKSDGRVQGVVLAPSRELVLQICDVIRRIAVGYKTVAFYGGHPMAEEVNSLSQTPDIIVATPGRLLDHLLRHNVDLRTVSTLVIDEYDKSLELGFHDEMRRIVRRMGSPSDIILTSATRLAEMPDFISLDGCETIDCTDGDSKKATAPRLNIAHVVSPARDKAQTLVDLIKSLPDGKVLVFVNHRESADRTYEILTRAGLPAGVYHGGLDQNEREKAVRLLDNGSRPILVTTDLAARGLDLDNLSAVIHYHMPVSAEAWTHRNGRTARAGATGDVFIITSEADNIPDYVVWDHDYNPTGRSDNPIRSRFATLHFNAEKKEKISRGDIVGFLCQKGGLSAGEIGKIDVSDHQSLVAVASEKAATLVKALASEKIKGQRVRISLVR